MDSRVYCLLQGSTFATICEMTDVFEGSIVRFMRRLDELLNQLIKAATVSRFAFFILDVQSKLGLKLLKAEK